MTYTETKKQLDKVVNLYKFGLLLIPETLNRITEIITGYISSVPGMELNRRIATENRLYIYGLRKLSEQIRTMNKCS